MKPKLKSDKKFWDVMKELKKREPIFHHPEYGTKREDFEKMTEKSFFEVGASGRRYSRKHILDILEKRFKKPPKDKWEVKDFHCFELSENIYLATYSLIQDSKRITRRSTIWKKYKNVWKVVYHQGTLAA